MDDKQLTNNLDEGDMMMGSGENDENDTTLDHQIFLPGPSNSHALSCDGQATFQSVDDVYKFLGRPGRYVMLVFCLLTFNNMAIAPNHAMGVFIGYSPDHVCQPFRENQTEYKSSYDQPQIKYAASYSNVLNSTNVNGTSAAPGDTNVTYLQCKTILKPDGGGKEVVSHCDSDSGSWEFNVIDGESSSVTEWDLVCDRAYLANLANTFYYIGVMVGGIFFGYVSDVFGRKVALLCSLYMTVGVGVAVVFTRDLTAFFVLRTIMGVAIQGLQTSTYIRLVEMFTPKHRSVYVTTYTAFWAFSLVTLGLAAWVIRDWRLLQVAYAVPAGIAALYLWIFPESLRWLISQGKDKQATQIIQRIARFNGRPFEHGYFKEKLMAETTTDGNTTKEKASYLDLVRTPQLRKRIILMSYITFATNVGYWGLTYNTTAMVGNKYLNFTLGSVAESIMSVLNIFIIKRFGKKKALIAYFMCGGVCCISMSSLVAETTELAVTTVLIISTLGRLTSGGLFVANDLYMAELFPTVVRNMGLGVCIFMGRIGAVFTPLIFTAGLYTFQHFPLLVFGLVTIAGGLVTFVLPETGKLNLPETIEDVIIVEAAKAEKKQNKKNGMLLKPLDQEMSQDQKGDNGLI